MRTKLLSLEDAQDFLGEELSKGTSNTHDLQAAKAVIQVAMQYDLTLRQQECIRLYFFEGKTMEQVGDELGIGKSTVYRHLQKALARMKRALTYATALKERAEKNKA